LKRILGRTLGVLAVVAIACGTFFYFEPLAIYDAIIRYHLWRQHVESKYVQVDGYEIHYFEATPPGMQDKPRWEQGKPLVLIHGLGSRGEDWSPMIPTLAASGFHVYVPDLLGFGRSPQPDLDYTIPLQEHIVREFMDAVGAEDADVGGWSMGGWVALKLTLDDPEMVDRLVVFDTAGIYFPPTFDATLFAPHDAASMFRLQTMLTPQPKPLPGFALRAAIRRLQSNGWVIQRSVASMEGGKDLLDFRVGEIKKPTLIVWGLQDKLIPMSAGASLHRLIPGSSMVVVSGCGHLAPSECSKPILHQMVRFLKSERPAPGSETTVDGTQK
jgi:pimeloyl-ACP methyl ester carboxylesterase